MTTLAYSHTLVAGTPENINDVQDMFNDARTVINGNLDATNLATTAKPATLMGAYRTVGEASLVLTTFMTGATTWLPSETGTTLSLGVASAGPPVFFPITLADYAVSGLTTQFRVQAATITNATAPAVSFTFALGLITGLGGTGGNISITNVTLNPTNVTRTTPSASASYIDSTADFTIAATGVYVLVVSASGTPAANSNTSFRLRLQTHNI